MQIDARTININEVRQHITPIKNKKHIPFLQSDYVLNKDGNIKLCDFNIRKWLIESRNTDNVYYDEFSERYIFRDGKTERPLSDRDITAIRLDACIDTFKAHKLRDQDIIDGLYSICDTRNPVKELIQSLQWDGIPRAERLLIDNYGAPDNAYIKEATKLFVLAIIARVFNPGTKFDYMPVLQGAQGLGKSSFFKSMAINEQWFAEVGAADMADKKLLGEKAAGKILLEYGELDGIRKTAATRLKATITSTDDNYRAAYARGDAKSRPRKYIIGGTTNSGTYLSDPSGNRRFLPIPITKAHFLDRETVLQVYAEMYEVYLSGNYQLYLSDEVDAIANEYRDDATMLISDDYIESIQYHIEKEIGEQSHVTANQIWHNLSTGCFVGVSFKDARPSICQALERLGWTYKAAKDKGCRTVIRAYWRPTDESSDETKPMETKEEQPNELRAPTEKTEDAARLEGLKKLKERIKAQAQTETKTEPEQIEVDLSTFEECVSDGSEYEGTSFDELLI